MAEQAADIVTTWTPSFVMVRSSSDDGQRWLMDNLDFQVGPPEGGSIPVEHRYFTDIVRGAVADGLSVQDSETGWFARP